MWISNRILLAALLGCSLGCKPKDNTKSPNIIDSAAGDVGDEIDGAGPSAEGVGNDVGNDIEGADETAEGAGKDVTGKSESPPPSGDENAVTSGG